MTELIIEMQKISTSKEVLSVITRLKNILSSRNIDAYIVGGFVRDGFIGKATNDLDIAVSGNALYIASELAHHFKTAMIPLDNVNQIARVVSPQNAPEWHLDFATLRGTIEQDLCSRDFTINAMAIPLNQITDSTSDVRPIDPLDGQTDLRRKIIRAASDVCFKEDPARLLRAIRFTAELNFSIENNTEALIRRDYNLVTSISAERQRDELCAMLQTNNAYESLRRLNSLGLLDLLIPELTQTKGVTQPKEHYWDVFNHSLQTVSEIERLFSSNSQFPETSLLSALSWSPQVIEHLRQEIVAGRTRYALLKLIALLHDIGKPETKTIETDGRMRFLGHSKIGADIAIRIMERLKFSNREIRIANIVIENHLRPGYLVKEELPSRRAVYRYFRDTAEAGIDTLLLCLADHLAARGPMLDMAHWYRHIEVTHYMLHKWFQEQSTVTPPKLVNGHDLIKVFNLAPGPYIGQLLELIREAQAAGEIGSREEALQLAEKHLENNQ